MAGLGERVWSFITGATNSVGSDAPSAYTQDRSESEQRSASLENPAVPLGSMTSWSDLFGAYGIPVAAGVKVTPETAMRVSAVYACISRIANTLAMLPMGVYLETELGRELDKEDALQQLYVYGPDECMNWFDFVFILVASALAHGNGYALIERDKYMKPIGLRFLEPGECAPIYMNAGRIRYLYYNVFGEIVHKRDIIHIRNLGSNGVIGKSPIELFAEGIGLSLAAEQFGAAFFGQGAGGMGVLETDNVFKDNGAIDRLRKQFADRQAGLNNAHKPLILEQGMHYKAVTIPPNHAQFIETRNFQVEDIARMYSVPQHKIGKLDRSTNNNIEHQNKEFITDTILPWTERLRQEFERKLIAEDQKADKIIVFDFDFLLRGDSVAEAAKIKALFDTGSITPNEIRQRNNLNRKKGLDDTYAQMNMQRVLPGSHMGQKADPPKPGRSQKSGKVPTNENPAEA
ncbi:phage portal protein [Spirosoma sp. KNUC1025]|uniref:phage portal protein n=1 Tax=Spirosoma sp. KNUC1025 TaxID=2894082 RepID=UPI00386C79B9|nr:phage portal protein [Spirosoma sp. KNUC1025]